MQQHEQHNPGDHKDPWGKQTRWLLLVIAILLGFVLAAVANRGFF